MLRTGAERITFQSLISSEGLRCKKKMPIYKRLGNFQKMLTIQNLELNTLVANIISSEVKNSSKKLHYNIDWTQRAL